MIKKWLNQLSKKYYLSYNYKKLIIIALNKRNILYIFFRHPYKGASDFLETLIIRGIL